MGLNGMAYRIYKRNQTAEYLLCVVCHRAVLRLTQWHETETSSSYTVTTILVDFFFNAMQLLLELKLKLCVREGLVKSRKLTWIIRFRFGTRVSNLFYA